MTRNPLGGKIRSFLFCLVAVASASTLSAESLKLLAIGNSFTGSLNVDLPRIAKDCGCELEYCLLIVGDTFNGAFAVALSEGKTCSEAIAFAQRAATISVTRPGAQSSVPYRREVHLK